MIPEFFMNIVFGIVEGVFSVLPAIEWNVENAFFSTTLDLLRLACYVLPMGTIVAIIVIINALVLFRIFVSVVRTIWELLPLM